MTNILITGANGQLGMEFKSLFNYNTDFNFIYTGSKDLDITNYERVKEFILENDINVIINCAAYTSVEKAEREPSRANAINHLAVANMALLSKNNGVKLIHISTDYVFDGLKNKAYVESDHTNPKTAYGQSKLKGELAIKKINPKDSIIIRTSWLYSRFGNNFVKKIISAAKTSNMVHVVSDQIGCPTNARDLAKSILTILPRIKNDKVELFHFCNKGFCSWFKFAKTILKINNIDIDLVPISSNEKIININRPSFSVLSTSKIENKFKFVIPDWIESLKDNFELVKE